MITVATGLPRSGTSLLMQMLKAGGMPALSDGRRAPDDNNPRGYLEYEPVAQIARNHSWLAEAEGRAIKIVVPLVLRLPEGFEYEVVLIQRDLDEVLTSQRKMLGQGALVDDAILRPVFERQMDQTLRVLRDAPKVRLLGLVFHEVIADPFAASEQLAEFSSYALRTSAMAGVVDRRLYRQQNTQERVD